MSLNARIFEMSRIFECMYLHYVPTGMSIKVQTLKRRRQGHATVGMMRNVR